jgi:hypothetical protein
MYSGVILSDSEGSLSTQNSPKCLRAFSRTIAIVPFGHERGHEIFGATLLQTFRGSFAASQDDSIFTRIKRR